MLKNAYFVKDMELQDLINQLQELRVEISSLKGEVKMKASERYFTVAETCKILRVSRSTLHRMVVNKDLPVQKAYRRLLFTERDINQLLITKNV